MLLIRKYASQIWKIRLQTILLLINITIKLCPSFYINVKDEGVSFEEEIKKHLIIQVLVMRY